mgnify:FL=1
MAIISPKESLPGAAQAKKRHNTMKNNHKPIARFIHRDRLRNPRLGDTHYYERTTLFTFLSRYFATDAICRVFSRYGLLADLEYEQDGLYGIAFPFQDGKTRQLLSVQYDPATGKQTGEQPIGQRLMKGYDLQPAPALFGMHLLQEYPDDPVGILRDSRDALIMTLADNKRLWLATGNSNRNGYSLTDPAIMETLRGRSVTLYPASGLYDASLPIAHRMQEQDIDTTVSNAAEQLTTDMPSDARLTIADFVLRQIEEEQFYASYPFAAYDQSSGMAPYSFCNLQEQNEQTTPMPQMPDVPESFHPVNGNPNE